MTLHPDSVRWAIEFTNRHSDGDIFPAIPEISAISAQPEGLVSALSCKPLGNFEPQANRRFIVPKDTMSYRQATQLHPQDSILLAAIMYQYGEGVEKRRLSKERVFSYRFNPNLERGLYEAEGLWNQFWTTASDKSELYRYVLYCDIADFYNQIYHHTVENQLAESEFPNQAIKWVIRLLESTTEGVSRGIPIGPHGAHLVAECSLIPVDNSLRVNSVNFLRYADDLLIFCDSPDEVTNAQYIVASTLDKQQRLMLQHHKTQIFPADEFRDYCARMIEDRPISEDEEEILNIIKRYSSGNSYATITYNNITPEDWKAFSEETVSRIIEEYLQGEEVDYIRLRWFFRRLTQVGHPGALKVVIENIRSLEPCLPSICGYMASIQEIPPEDWEKLGDDLLGLLDSQPTFEREFARLSLLSLFSKNEYIDHFVKLVPRFSVGDAHTKREILLAARANGQTDWLRERKEDYGSMDPWQRMAFIYCASVLPRDEKKFFLNRQIPTCPFELELVKWSRTLNT